MKSRVGRHSYLSIFSLAIILFSVGLIGTTDQVINNALIYFAVITFIWGLTSWYRFYNTTLSGAELGRLKVPQSIKCLFGEDRCEEGDINIWTVMHFVIYFIAGLLFPNRYLFMLGASLFCEFFELMIASYNSKWIVDPIFNMFGYWLGNLLLR
jgi:hypothetical protein